MPALDVLWIVIWLGIIVIGGTSGFLRQVLLLASIYAAAILAGVGHPYLTKAFQVLAIKNLSADLINGYMFFLLFILVTGLLYFGLVSAFPETRPSSGRVGASPLTHGPQSTAVLAGGSGSPYSARLLDTAGGVLLGVVTGLLLIVGLYTAVAYLVQPSWPAADEVRLTLLDQVNRSVLMPVIQEKLPFVYTAFKPWFPVGTPGFPEF